MELKYCKTNEQVADILTKPLPVGKNEYFRLQMEVTNFEGRKSVDHMFLQSGSWSMNWLCFLIYSSTKLVGK